MIRRHYAIFRWQPGLGAFIVATFEKRSDAHAWAAVANDWLMERELYVAPGSYNEWHERRSRERAGLVKPRAVTPMEPPSFDPGRALSEGASYHAGNYADTRVRVDGDHKISLAFRPATPSSGRTRHVRWTCACGSVGRWDDASSTRHALDGSDRHVAAARRAERAWVRDRELFAQEEAARKARREEEDANL